jgi:hypothetical protein
MNTQSKTALRHTVNLALSIALVSAILAPLAQMAAAVMNV